MKRAVLYCRSSKDRHDASIDAQRRELQALARARNAALVGEFVDVVESGKDAERPGFRALIAALKDPRREWSEILALDTSRIARNVTIAVTFQHECRKRDVHLVFAKLPEVNPVVDLVMRQVMLAFDEVHSLMSREKGLAGMAENVRQGWRAGGRAPLGYRLESIDTGAVREGRPVTKSRLVPSDDAPRVAAYLQGRAAGRSARVLLRELGLAIAPSTATGVEWNALTYAGHTVWNVSNERTVDGYRRGRKRRPRAEWVIQRDTHEALITDGEAETLLARLEAVRDRTGYRTGPAYLLSGLLVTPEGRRWHGNRDAGGGYYRTGRRNVKADTVERLVLARVAADLDTPEFARAMAEGARKALAARQQGEDPAELERQVAVRDRKIARLAELVHETSAPRPLLAQIEQLEREREDLLRRRQAALQARAEVRDVRRITEADVRAFLRDLAGQLAALDRDQLKDFLAGIVERITLDPESLNCRIQYGIRLSTGDFVASPRRTGENPGLTAVSAFRIGRRLRLRAA